MSPSRPGAAGDDDPTVEAWLRRVQASAVPVRRTARVPLHQALGRRVAAPLIAPADLPSTPVSAMDGFALRLADLDAHGASPLPVAAELPARPGGIAELAPGTAARIMTGAPVPHGADAVIEVERTDADPHGLVPTHVRVTHRDGLRPGRHVRARGEEVAAGAVLARPGDVAGPGLLALAATLGIAELEVEQPVRVAVIVTGDELVDSADADRASVPGAVRESNGTMLAAALAGRGAEAHVVRCGDDVATFCAVLDAEASRSDLVITSGGIGQGAYDVVKAALGPSGRGTSTFVHVRLRPGGPQGLGNVALADSATRVPVVHLPGTPVGALVGFHLFVRPLLEPAALGAISRVPVRSAPDGVERRSATPRHDAGSGALRVAPGRLARAEDGSLAVDLLPGSRLAPYGRADCLVLCEGPLAARGDEVAVLVL